MIRVLVLTHGTLGTALLQTAERILGPQENAAAVDIPDNDSLAGICRHAESAVQDACANEGTIILTDLLGGTPCNACLPLCSVNRVEVVAGVNLPMVISALRSRASLNLEDLARKVIDDGHRSIVDAKAQLLKRMT